MTAGGVMVSEPGYRLAANGREHAEDERLDLLEQLFDPGSRRRPGWRSRPPLFAHGLTDTVSITGPVARAEPALLFSEAHFLLKNQRP